MAAFQLIKADKDSSARRGVLSTAHGDVQTPVFMPVGTAGAVKGLMPAQLKEVGVQMLLANTYHLMLRPGVERVGELGGLHKLMAWDRPILTDSGGYQVFSLNALTKITDDGVEFASHVDGAKFHLDARRATEIQNRLGADVVMCFDQCTPYPCPEAELKVAVKRTIAWAQQCREAHDASTGQALFGIVQGGLDTELRAHCARELVGMDFDGYAIGGLSVGEGHELMTKTVSTTAPLLPEDKPRYLMGVGMPMDIIAAVAAGVDMFDCVLPTRNGRNAYAFTENGPLRLRNNAHIGDTDPIDPNCACYCCANFTRASLRHFFNVKEMLGPILVSIHNISFYQRLMTCMREAIEKGQFAAWVAENAEKYRYGGFEQSM